MIFQSKQTIILAFCLLCLPIFGQNTLSKIDSILQKAYNNQALNGSVLIAKDGKTIFEKQLRFETGEKWEYADIGYDILATIIEKVSGQTYQKFLKKQVFRPAKMHNTEGVLVTDIRRIKAKNLARGYIQDSVKGYELAHEVRNFVFYLGDFYGDGSVITTAEDLKKWDDALRTYMLADSVHFGEAYRPIIRKDGSVYEMQKGVSYGFGWSLRDEAPMGKIYSHGGGHPGFTTNYFRFPDKKMVLIVCRNVETKASFAPYLQAIRALLPAL